MAKIRKQIYILTEQESQLKQISEARGLSEAEIIRQALDAQVNRYAPLVRDMHAWGLEAKFIQYLIEQGPVKSDRSWTRASLYDE